MTRISRHLGALAALALIAVLGLAAPAALAQECPRTSLGEIESEVMCPVCGTPLGLATEAPQAQRERAFIQELIDDCRSKDEIKESLVAEYGESVLALPGDGDAGGLGDVLVYVVPGLGLLLAAGGIALAVGRWRGRRPAGPGAGASGGDSTRLDADMERYEL